MKRVAHIALIGVTLTLSACNGWPKAAPLSKAEHRREKFPTYTKVAAEATDTFTFEGRRWVVEPAVVELHGASLQAVGSAGSVSINAQKGEKSPYDVLYTPAEGGKWHAVQPID